MNKKEAFVGITKEKEIASDMIRIYPSTHRELRRIAKLTNSTIARLVDYLVTT
jgi:hypothetical protein